LENFEMKKTLIAIAALAATGAFAQSTVTLYGTVDASFNHATQDGVSKNFLGNSQLGSSKLGFMGSEDLGGGLKANFKLEGGLANDSGNGKASNSSNQTSGTIAAGTTVGSQGLVFQRYSYVGLSGNFGEVRLGRDYVSTFLGVQAAVDPFGTNGPADSTGMALKLAANTTTNASNMIEYTTPVISGFSANGQVWQGENASNSALGKTTGNGTSIIGTYANGPIFASLGQATTKGLTTATTGDYTLTSLSASYDFGVAKAVYTYAREKLAQTVEAKNTTNLIGVIVPYGAANFKADYIRGERTVVAAGKGDLLGLGVDYALSKRTTLYTTYAHVKNSDGGASYSTGGIGGATVNGSSSNYAIGAKHTF
jgi:predicted porin